MLLSFNVGHTGGTWRDKYIQGVQCENNNNKTVGQNSWAVLTNLIQNLDPILTSQISGGPRDIFVSLICEVTWSFLF